MNFKDKVILIVGASSGMGRIVATKLGSAGAKLIVTARTKERLDSLAADIINKGGSCLPIVADALDEDAAERVVKAAVERFGCIDVVLLNAGGAPAIDMRTMNAAEVKSYMRSNYDVTVNYLFPVLEQMKKQRSGFVVHTNSAAGFLGVPLQGPYCAAKAASRLLIDTCRLEFAEYGIKFLSIYPGFVATERTQGDGMPAPGEISEEKGAGHILFAIQKEKANYLFPFLLRWQIRLALILPMRILNLMMKSDVPRSIELGGSQRDE